MHFHDFGMLRRIIKSKNYFHPVKTRMLRQPQPLLKGGQQQAGTGSCRSCWTTCGSFLSNGRYLRINGAEMINCGDRQLLILSLPFPTYHKFPMRLKKFSFYTADAHFQRLRKTILSCASSLVNVYNGVCQRINFPMIFTCNSFCNESTDSENRTRVKGFERKGSNEQNVHYNFSKLGNVKSGRPITRAKGSCIKRASIPDRMGIGI